MNASRTFLFHFLLTAWLAFGVAGSAAKADQTNLPASRPEKKSAAELVNPARAEKLVAEKKVVVLDVRTPAEFAAGHIAGATNLDFRDKEFKAKVAKLDKNQPYLVNCAAGGRSARACEAMGQLDFKVLYDLQGGFTAWEKAGKPVKK
jgi:rhodanese-related sulfurtransferase